MYTSIFMRFRQSLNLIKKLGCKDREMKFLYPQSYNFYKAKKSLIFDFIKRLVC